MNEIAKYPSLEDKVVIITGGASGIGTSIVEQFLHQGSKVAFLDKEQDLGENLVKKFNNFKHSLTFKHCDLININNLKKTINEIREELGLISILVNNAANDERHSIDSVTEEFWDDNIDITDDLEEDWETVVTKPVVPLPGKTKAKYIKAKNKKTKTRIKKKPKTKAKGKSNSNTKQSNTNGGKINTNNMDPADWMTDDELEEYLDNVYGIDWL